MQVKFRLTPTWELIALAALCVLTRLPQLLSPNLVLDGDEAVVGLMAKHLHDGTELPVFFWGQAYGFSLVESALGALAFFVGGVNDYSLKAAMLLLWTTGVVFLYKAFRSCAPRDSRWPFLISIVFILVPIWAAWSMKARGGYLTSFTATSIVLWLLLEKKFPLTPRLLFGIGLLLTVIFESQALWLAGLAPLVAYRMLQRFRLRNVAALFAGITLSSLLFWHLTQTASHYWQPVIFSLKGEDFWRHLRALPENLYNSQHGYFYLQYFIAPSLFSAMTSVAVLLLLAVITASGVYLAIKRRIRANALFFMALIAVWATISYSLFFSGDFIPRYLLPLPGWICLALLLLARNLRFSTAVRVQAGVFIILGIGSLISFKDYSFQSPTRADLLQLAEYLEHQGSHRLFVIRSGLFHWQITFYSKEKLIARNEQRTDRLPAYTQMVNAAFAKGERTALIRENYIPGVPGDSTVVIGHYAVLIQPDSARLQQFGFEF